MPFDTALVAAGFLVGLLVGLTGMGGGAVMTPFLISVVGIGPVVAVGTDLVYSAATKIVGAWLHTRQRTVDFVLVKRLALGSVPAGLAAVALIRLLPGAGVNADQAVRRALGAVLILVAIVMLCRIFAASERTLPERWRAALEGRGTIVAGAIFSMPRNKVRCPKIVPTARNSRTDAWSHSGCFSAAKTSNDVEYSFVAPMVHA